MGIGYILMWWIGVSAGFQIVQSLQSNKSDKIPQVLINALNLLAMALVAPVSLDLAGYVGALFWGTFVFAPRILRKRIAKRALELQLSAAIREAYLLSLLEPWGKGRRWAAAFTHLKDARKRGTLATVLTSLGGRDIDPVVVQALASALGFEGNWTGVLNLAISLPGREAELGPLVLRALGETGNLEEQRALYRRLFLSGAFPEQTEAAATMIVLAFQGDAAGLEPLFHGPLVTLPADVKEFWLATALWARGDLIKSTPLFQNLLRSARSERTRRGAELRLSQTPPTNTAPLPASDQLLFRSALAGTTRPPPRRPHAPATTFFIAANVVVFILVELTGGATNKENLFRWGLLLPEAVAAGQYWRLLAACFLHFGVLHLFMNMLALNFVGRFVEDAVGSVRFALLYLVYGVGSMGFVTYLSLRGTLPEQTLVGASGAITGLIGLSMSLFLKAWLRDRHPSNLQRLRSVFVAVLIQVAFDLLTPEVSFTAHMSGTVLGFLTGLLPVKNPLREHLIEQLGSSKQVERGLVGHI